MKKKNSWRKNNKRVSKNNKRVIKMNIKKEPMPVTRGLNDTQDSSTNSRMVADAPPKIKSDPRLPILRGFGIGRSIVVHRPFCDKFHTHGWDRKLTARDIYYPAKQRITRAPASTDHPGRCSTNGAEGNNT
jgi:hypothetical protein